MSGQEDIFRKWLDETRGGKVCPDEVKPLFESIIKNSPSDFLSCIVTSREGSNPGIMDTEVWRQVIDQAVAATHATAPSAMTALVGRTLAASPP
eukprot:4331794-Prymnesium_polylepis.1